jgi:CubicO group peptidase (beta-lactamase class C family)
VEKRTLQARVSAGEDQAWSVEDVVEMARDMGALHPPGVTKRASYSDTNYQLLGRLVEEVEEMSINAPR